jgi:perosamine synthetase
MTVLAPISDKSTMKALSDGSNQDIPVVGASTSGQEWRPFWQTIPRFEREYCFGDFLQALSALLPGTVRDTAFGNCFPAAERFLFRSGRECLFAILKAFKLRSRARVGVPLYCCGSVFEAIAAAGCVPVFLDVDLGTYSLDLDCLERKRSMLEAIVVVHTFGYPANLAEIRTCLGTAEIPVIEDCAHALFSTSQGSLVGTHTQASFFSFGLHKPAAAGGGGIALFNDTALAKTAVRELALPAAESRWCELRHATLSWARALVYHRPVYGALLASPLGRFREGCMDSNRAGDVVEDTIEYSLKRMRLSNQILLENRLREFRRKLARLSRNTYHLRTATQGVALEIPEEPSHGQWNHYLLPVRYTDAINRTLGCRFLKQLRVDTCPIFRNCIRNARLFGYTGGCPKAEEAVQTVCTVPHHPWLSDSQINFMGEALRRSVEAEP